MKIRISRNRDKLVEKGLKVTPQRLAILEAIYTLNNHPTAEMIMNHIKDIHPGISTATVYKVLDAFEEKQLIKKVKTDRDVKRYEGITEKHHHLYSSESDQIKDYMNTELDQLLAEFFNENRIDGFAIEEIKVQINGKFLDPGNE